MKTLPFLCPRCGEHVEAIMLHEPIYADPYEPMLRCPECNAEWRIMVDCTNLKELET